MAMINYADKVALNQNSNIADINKCNATDMNELKNAFNNQVAFGWYQTGLSPTFKFSSWDSSTKTGVVNSNLDLTPYLSVGMKVKFTQSGATKYGIITKITSTRLTLFLGTDYSINNSAISNTYYSMLKTPYGFPMSPSKWSVQYYLTSAQGQDSPSQNTYYNPNGIGFNVPIGSWEISFKGNIYTAYTSAGDRLGKVALSKTKNTPSDRKLESGTYIYIGTTGGLSLPISCTPTIIDETAKVFYYVIISCADTNSTLIQLDAAFNPFSVLCKCAYL